MKRLMLLPLLFVLAFANAPGTLSKKERKFAREHLRETKKDLLQAVSKLSETQLKWKASPEKWSVEECVKHIAASEQMMWQTMENGLSQAPNPEKRAEIKFTDEQLIKGVQDRTSKFQAPEPIQPRNSPFQNTAEALQSFKTNRDKAIRYVKDTQEDLRNHVINFPVGVMDAYQMILLMSAHCNRHTQQIREVMADPNFPKE
ncbi:MAG TPA: DinB family protein [Chitinophagaceae bacterium]|nr:DinB family protein [Chitinophagaceae bacterium]